MKPKPFIELKKLTEPVAFVQGRHARPLDGGNVDERVRLSIIALDEAETLHRVEDLDRSGCLLAGQLTLRAAAAIGRSRAPLDRHRLAFNAKVGRRNAAPAVHQGELERLAVGKVGETGLLDRRDVHEHIFAAIIANDEAEALLRVEEFDDAFAFANDLRGHSATTAAAAAETAAAPTAAAAKATASAAAAVASGALTESAAAAAAAIAAASTAAATVTAALLETAAIRETRFLEKSVALIPAATATIALAPSVETHFRLNFRVPNPMKKPTRWAPRRNRSRAILTHARFSALHEKDTGLQ
jgi:hypothetical protein